MKKTELLEKIQELTWELANANRCIESEQRTARELRTKIHRLGEYGTACNVRLAAVHAALNAPGSEAKATHRGGSPANIPGYYIKREGV